MEKASPFQKSQSLVKEKSPLMKPLEVQLPSQGSDEFEEGEWDLGSFLKKHKFHPLNFLLASQLSLLGRTEEFYLYSFFSMEMEQHFVLKVFNNEGLFELEKRVYEKMENTKCTLRLVNSFAFEFQTEGNKEEGLQMVKDKQFYLVLEHFKANLLQKINNSTPPDVESRPSNLKSSQQQQQQSGRQFFSEQQVRNFLVRMAALLGDLQRKRIVHRNLKPSNIAVMSEQLEDLRLHNFELASILPSLEFLGTRPSSLYKELGSPSKRDAFCPENLIELDIETCSIIYSSPLVLDTVSKYLEQRSSSSHNDPHHQQLQPSSSFALQNTFQTFEMYNPFVEDVFSLGLIALQMCTLCSSTQLKEMRKTEKTLKEAVAREIKGVYSENVKCILLIMMQWQSLQRPDFIQLESVIRDILHIPDCRALFSKLSYHQSNVFAPVLISPSLPVIDQIYEDINEFLTLKKIEAVEALQRTPGGGKGRQQSKFELTSSRLTCPVHEEEPFVYFCRRDQEFVCEGCGQEGRHNEHWETEVEDLRHRTKELQEAFELGWQAQQQQHASVKVRKSMIRSGKHIDQFFDGLIQRILQLHNQVKLEFRERFDEDELQEQFNKHVLKQESNFKQQKEEIGEFLQESRLAEVYTNQECYQEQLREMDKLSQNLGTYEKLLVSKSSRLNERTQDKTDLESDLVDMIKAFVEKKL